MDAPAVTNATVDADVQKAVRMAIAATERKDYPTALRLFTHLYGNPMLNTPVDGLSYYGLCVALSEKQTKKGVDLCREAMRHQFYDSTHHANLIRLHLAKGNRKLAVQAMEEGLKGLPGDKRLTQLREEMGWRKRNPIPFLPRDNAMNQWLGARKRGQATSFGAENASTASTTTFNLQRLQPLQMLLFGFLGFATMFTITFYILYQRAYG